MKSNMVHDFSKVPQAKIPRSKFKAPYTYKSSFDMDVIVPYLCMEALPGDTISVDTNILARLATPIYPLMDNAYLSVYWFEVPYRIIWDNSKKFFGERVDPADSIDITLPQIVCPAGGVAEGDTHDYLGIPIGTKSGSLSISALPTRAIHKIWNYWFRDQNLQDSEVVDTDDGPDTYTDYDNLLYRCKKHDYFTSGLPSPQKSGRTGESVSLPLGTKAPITGLAINTQTPDFTTNQTVYETSASSSATYTDGWTSMKIEEDVDNLGYPGVFADLTNATAATINQLRLALKTQVFLEADMRNGTRYSELCYSHFGVTNDHRAHEPIFLGSKTIPLIVSEIAQTSATSGSQALGDLAAKGTVSGHGGFTRSFVEHSFVIGLVTTHADLTYQTSLNRMWTRQTRFDHYWPILQHLGEQAVLLKEIYCDTASGNNDNVFCYQERYAEYKYVPSLITGAFRSAAATPLDAWHLSETFASAPSFNSTFIKSTTPMDRAIVTATEPHLIFDSFSEITMVRPMSLYSVPGMDSKF